MGLNTNSNGVEMAQEVVTGAALGGLNAASNSGMFIGNFNVFVYGVFVGTVALQCSFDGGTTWIPVISKRTGAAITFTAPGALQEDEVEPGVFYRLQVTAYTSGAASWRLSAGASRGNDGRLS